MEALFDDARGKEVLFHVKFTVVGNEYLSQLIDFFRVVIAEYEVVAQLLGYVIPCQASNEENFEGLPLESFHTLQEIYDVLKTFLEVLSKEPIHDVNYFSFSFVIELNFNLQRHFPFFSFFLISFVPSGIDIFEDFDECFDVCGQLNELQNDVLDVLGSEPFLDLGVRVVISITGLILLDNPEHETLNHVNHPEHGLRVHL